MKGLICILAVLGSVSVSAQQGTADLRGKVVDQQGGALPGVTLVVKHQASGLFRETVSGADGSFFLSAMSPGVYQVSAELAGFKKYQRRDVRLEVGGTTQLEVPLEVGGIDEAVTVTGEAPLVDTTSKEIGGRVTEQEFVDPPSFNRNFAGYLGMMPGVVATINLNRSAPTPSAPRVRASGTWPTRWTVRTTTTRSTAAPAGRRRVCRSRPCRSSNC